MSFRRWNRISVYDFRNPCVVRAARETFLFASQLSLCPRLDSSLHHDGACGRDRLAKRSSKSSGPHGAHHLPAPAHPEHDLVGPFFRAPVASLRSRGYFVPLGHDLGYNSAIFQDLDAGRRVTHSLYSVGDLCGRAESRDLSFESVKTGLKITD